MKSFNLKTKSGLPLDEAVSWLQKSLRRADEIIALWLMEVLLSSGFQRYALYRCWITALEDVGLAAPDVCRSVTEIYQSSLAGIVMAGGRSSMSFWSETSTHGLAKA